MKAKLPIKTDWVTVQAAVKILKGKGISRGFTTLYSHARTGKLTSQVMAKGKKKKRYLIYVPSLEAYAFKILESEGSGRS